MIKASVLAFLLGVVSAAGYSAISSQGNLGKVAPTPGTAAGEAMMPTLQLRR